MEIDSIVCQPVPNVRFEMNFQARIRRLNKSIHGSTNSKTMHTNSGKSVTVFWFFAPGCALNNETPFYIQIEWQQRAKNVNALSSDHKKTRTENRYKFRIKRVINVHCISYDIIFCCRALNRISLWQVIHCFVCEKKLGRAIALLDGLFSRKSMLCTAFSCYLSLWGQFLVNKTRCRSMQSIRQMK